MTDTAHSTRLLNAWRIAGWGALAALLMLPAIAMNFTEEVDWTGSDFVFASILLLFLGASVEFAVHGARRAPARIAIVIAGFAAFFTFWSNGAVGIIGAEGEPLNNGFYFLVLAGVAAALFTRLRAKRMQVVTAVLAVSQLVMGVIALQVMPGHGVEWGVLAFFAILWGVSSFFFQRAARMAI